MSVTTHSANWQVTIMIMINGIFIRGNTEWKAMDNELLCTEEEHDYIQHEVIWMSSSEHVQL